MRLSLGLLLLSGCVCSPKLVDVLPCGTTCYTSDAGTPGQGPCQKGTWYCSVDAPPVCLEEVGPSEEVCDDIDNDCDGRVDEPLWHYCSSACGEGTETCYRGTWTACTAPLPSPEICDGKDSDCDGQVDEQADLPTEFCYTGPPESVLLGECRPGVARCRIGRSVCANEVLPSKEVCDGKDNDCDGEVDEGLTAGVDFVFIVDNSGSMQGTLQAVKSASSVFATSYASHPEIRWAIVGAPDTDPAHDGEVSLVSYLADPITFASLMALQDALGGGREPSIDALVQVASYANPLKLNWAPDAERHAVLFTDEPPQSYVLPPYSVWDSIAAISYAGPKFHVHIFAAPYDVGAFEALGPARQLTVLPLSDDPAVMLAALETLVRHATCGP